MSLKSLKYALKHALRDEFEPGAVLRWDVVKKQAVDGRDDVIYRYAAIKASNGLWYTSAQDQKARRTRAEHTDALADFYIRDIYRSATIFDKIDRSMTFEDLVGVLTSDEVSNVCVATGWESLS